jgi:cytochrome d ubiquinol oxidase subunit II
MDEAVAVVLFVCVTAYCVFGGADFGAGFWDLVAGGAEAGRRPRALVDHSIGPVWEANHVWLIFTLVVLWTAFSEAFAAIGLTLFIPLTLAAFGIVLRGSSFAFRKMMLSDTERRPYGAVFATSSVIVPFCLGAIAGGIASGRVPADGTGSLVTSWINPTSVLGGVLAVIVCAFLAATYLVWDARRLGDADLVEYFRRRAVAAAIVAGATAAGGVFVLYTDDDYLFHGLLSRGLPFVILSALCGLGSLWLLVKDVHRYARVLAIGAVASIIWGWGVAQWPYLLPETLKIEAGAAPSGTLTAVLVVFAVAIVVLGPSIALLYSLDQRSLLVGDSPDQGDGADRPDTVA